MALSPFFVRLRHCSLIFAGKGQSLQFPLQVPETDRECNGDVTTAIIQLRVEEIYWRGFCRARQG